MTSTEPEIRFSALPAAAAPDGTEIAPVVQGGVTKKIPVGAANGLATLGEDGKHLPSQSGTYDALNENVVHGFGPNVVEGNVKGSVISGGGLNAGGVDYPNIIRNTGAVVDAGNLGVISGGYDNIIDGAIASTMAGGAHHRISNPATHATIGGGSYGTISGGNYGTIAGGTQNTVTANNGFIGGGSVNTVSGDGAVVAGGNNNLSSGTQASVGGGKSNQASGATSVIGGGELNTNNSGGTHAVISGGLSNNVSATGSYSAVAGGRSNQVTKLYGAIPGGRNNLVLEDYGVASGYEARAHSFGQAAHAAGFFAAKGDAQTSTVVARNVTTTAAQTDLFLDGAAATKGLTIPTDTTWAFSIVVVARRTDADNESAAYKIEGCIDNNAGVSAVVGIETKTVIAEDIPAWDVAIAYSANLLRVRVTGEAAKTIRWVARIELVEVTG